MKNVFSVALVLFLFVPLTASAVGSGGGGGGGGGGGSSCSTDTYNCGQWSDCSLDGMQTRSCQLSNNCPSVTDPEPVTSQSCTPECTSDTWTCAGWSPCFSDSTQSRKCTKSFDCSLTETSSPITSQSCQPACTKDTWSCDDWSVCSGDGKQSRLCSLTFDCEHDNATSPATSQSCTPDCKVDTWNCESWGICDSYGNQSRSCTLAKDCSGVVTDKPTANQRCDHLQCDQETVYERVFCRLNLAPEGVKRDLEIEYLPEACRPFDGRDREECLEYYKKYWPCWKEQTLEKRVECARGVLELGSNEITEQKNACKGDEECLDELREHVHHLIVFRFYDLEQRAEAWAVEGVDLGKTAEFVTKVIENKVAFLKAKTYEDRKAVIEKMRADWNTHVAYARTILKR